MSRKDEMTQVRLIGAGLVCAGLIVLIVVGFIFYNEFRISVPKQHIAVMTQLTGEDVEGNKPIIDGQKGLQKTLLTEGRYFINPYNWDWKIYPMIEIPANKMGVRIRLYGDNLPYGHFLATKENEKGIVEDVLRPGLHAINAVIEGQEALRPKRDYTEIIKLVDPITINAGYRGVVTNRSGPIPENPNTITVEKNFRGVQKESLEEGTYYLNPYTSKVHQIDCRSQRFKLGEKYEMVFPSKDGFLVSLDGVIEFRVIPEKAAEVFVMYNDEANDKEGEAGIDQEIINKIIMPSALSFCRLEGSKSTGRDFIGGETRSQFQKNFQTAMQKACTGSGIEIIQALITEVSPPQEIAGPVRLREIAKQKLKQFKEQRSQQEEEAKLATEKALILQKQALVAAEQLVVKSVTEANQQQAVDVTKAYQDKKVAELDLKAATDKASSITSKKKAEAGIIEFQNIAEASGWKAAVTALGGDGEAYARYVLLEKLAPSYKSIMFNTQDSPFMEIFKTFNSNNKPVKKEGAKE